MRSVILVLFFTLAAIVHGQTELPIDSIAPRLVGCWYAGDGGVRGYYCFSVEGTVNIRPSGKGREELNGEWEVDKKGQVTVINGKSRTRYLVERLEGDGFILVTPKNGVRMEGHREKPKGWR
jgi:hypothetical protein